MIAKAVVEARSFGVADFPKPKPGEPPRETFTYIDESTSRDPQMVTILVEPGLPHDDRPQKGDICMMVMQLEQVERVVTRQDREDAGRTYSASTKQYRAKLLAFESVTKAAAVAAKPAKAAA